MKKQSNANRINLFISALLITSYVICSYFFSDFTKTLSTQMVILVNIGIFLVFGLLVFYATRVGEGKTVKRFSLSTLIVLDIPALYIIVAALIDGMFMHNEIVSNTTILLLASAALGYGLPYTFISGFETISQEDSLNDEESANTSDVESTLDLDSGDVQEDSEGETEDLDVETDVIDEDQVQEDVIKESEQEDKTDE